MEIEIAVASFLLVILTLLASVDMAFSQLSDISLRKLFSEAEENKKPRSIEFLREVTGNRPRFRFALSSAIQILLIVFSVIVVLIVYRYFQSPLEMLIYSLLIGLALSVIFRQVIPRFITWTNPEGRLLRLLPLTKPIYSVLPFIADPIEPSFRGREMIRDEMTIAQEDGDEKTEDDADHIQALIDVGEAEGIIEEDERKLIEKMFEFGDTEVDQIMTPRTEIVALSADSTVKNARDLMIEEKFSRLPIYKENIDNIDGVIYVRDILQAWADGRENTAITEILRPAYFVPETKSVSDLLQNMQLSHVQIAMVVDEYGGVAGLVTVEDILEEIVGEIEDEDLEGKIVEIVETEGGFYEVLASTEIAKIERLFGIEIEDDDFTTIAGLVTTEAGYVPKVNEKLTIRGLDVVILKAEDKRIKLLKVRKNDPQSENQLA